MGGADGERIVPGTVVVRNLGPAHQAAIHYGKVPLDAVVDLHPGRIQLVADCLASGQSGSQQGAAHAGEGVEDFFPLLGEEADDLRHDLGGLHRAMGFAQAHGRVWRVERLEDRAGPEEPLGTAEVVQAIFSRARAGGAVHDFEGQSPLGHCHTLLYPRTASARPGGRAASSSGPWAGMEYSSFSGRTLPVRWSGGLIPPGAAGLLSHGGAARPRRSARG